MTVNAALAARIEAMRLSRLAVRDQLRAQGQKVNYISASEINRLARIWFLDHGAELIDAALCNVLRATLQHPARNRRVRERIRENAQ
jgi:hypothetical protein